MARLRATDGCPWDREQDLSTLIPFIIEEAHEVVAAIESGSKDALKEELGDLLFQVVFASQLASEANEFTIKDVIEENISKMTRRHPHVFGDASAETSKEVLLKWDEIKKAEEKKKNHGGYLSNVPETLPSLLRAHKISKKAAKTGFDWRSTEEVMDKLEEELNEFKDALKRKDTKNVEEELGDILFALVNVARFVEVNPEEALRKTIGRFMYRFHFIEKSLEEKNKSLSNSSLDEMEALWNEAKQKEKNKAISDG